MRRAVCGARADFLWRLGGGCVVLALVAACTSPAPPEPAPETRRALQQGEVVGYVTEDDAHAWLGIPFATPPVGDLGWRAPRPPESWSGLLEAVEFGASCVQFAGMSGPGSGAEGAELAGDEDCLYLNVFAPPFPPGEVPTGEERLPVMVWIHGGGNSVGDALPYEGSLLAKAGPVVVVTIHYRLGVFGWFAHASLRDGADRADASGNFGTLDVVAALEWVRDNIAAFGGDPDRVLVFGESAGGTDTHAMLLSPRAAGLFHRAIAQSGSAQTTPLHEAENYADAETSPGAPYSSSELLLDLVQRDGKASDRAGAKSVVSEMSAAEIATYLRGKSPDELLAFFGGAGFGGMYPSPELIRDGYVLPETSAKEAFESGRYNHVPTILGTNRDEVKLFALANSHNLAHLGGLPLWVSDRPMYDAASEYATKKWKLRGVDDPARGMRAHQSDVWAYRFDWDELRSPLGWDLPGIVGAAHALEIPFVFGWLTLGPVTPIVFDPDNAETDRVLSDAMMSYWTEFAYTGNPDRGRHGDLQPWPAWGLEPGAAKLLVFDTTNDGGIRPSPEEVDEATILAQVRADPRLTTPRDRCEVFADLSRRGPAADEEQYAQAAAGECDEYPLSAYPWKD